MWIAMAACQQDPGAPSATVEIAVRPGLRDLVATAVATDPDGDPVTLAWRWLADGAPTEHRTDRVPATALTPGQTWTVEVTPSDGAVTGAAASASVVIPAPAGTNVLVVLADDVGVDKLAVYDPANPAVATPTIDGLAAQGVVFDRAYSAPVCTPSRANLLTGRYGRRTGVGSLVLNASDRLAIASVLVPEVLPLARGGQVWAAEALGKWHLSTTGRDHPNVQGFGYFSGVFGAFSDTAPPLNGYYDWEETTNGVVVGRSTVYNTTDIVDDALARVAQLQEPFFLYVAFNAAHEPLVPPPLALSDEPVDETSDEPALHRAVLQALDAELGRLLAGIPADVRARTTVIFTADNGTKDLAVEAPYRPDRAKGTLYEGGVHVPLIVAGPLVAAPGARSDALVHLVDVFPTVADIAGVPLTDLDGGRSGVEVTPGDVRVIDGVSLLPYLADPTTPSQRDYLFVEELEPVGPPPYSLDDIAVRDATHKLLRRNGRLELYALQPGAVDEGAELLADGTSEEEQAIVDTLSAQIDSFVADVVYEGF